MTFIILRLHFISKRSKVNITVTSWCSARTLSWPLLHNWGIEGWLWACFTFELVTQIPWCSPGSCADCRDLQSESALVQTCEYIQGMLSWTNTLRDIQQKSTAAHWFCSYWSSGGCCCTMWWCSVSQWRLYVSHRKGFTGTIHVSTMRTCISPTTTPYIFLFNYAGFIEWGHGYKNLNSEALSPGYTTVCFLNSQ